jgi:hypothetical protein
VRVKVESRGRNQMASRDLFLVVQVVYSLRGKMVRIKLSEKSIQDKEKSRDAPLVRPNPASDKEERVSTTTSLSLSVPSGSYTRESILRGSLS